MTADNTKMERISHSVLGELQAVLPMFVTPCPHWAERGRCPLNDRTQRNAQYLNCAIFFLDLGVFQQFGSITVMNDLPLINDVSAV